MFLFNEFIFSLLIFVSAENDVIAIVCDTHLLNTWHRSALNRRLIH